MQIAILGREQTLCRAEVETVADRFEHFSNQVSLLDTNRSIDQFGGIIAFGKIVARGHSSNKTKWIINEIINYLKNQPTSSKVSFGISSYGAAMNPKKLLALGLTIKKSLKEHGLSTRLVTPKEVTISAAQIKYNQLLDNNNAQFVICENNSEVILAVITQIQDIDWYSERDYDRPVRDSKVGMLPPKLAQIMINLTQPEMEDTIVDPFCGTGVILAEALLWNYACFGSDISARMVDYSEQNLAWLTTKRTITADYQLKTGDARMLAFDTIKQPVVVTEGYLGPVDTLPNESEKQSIFELYRDFLTHCAKHVHKCTLAFPAWSDAQEPTLVRFLDEITKLGYNNKAFTGSTLLIYKRDNQRVGRAILPLIKD